MTGSTIAIEDGTAGVTTVKNGDGLVGGLSDVPSTATTTATDDSIPGGPMSPVNIHSEVKLGGVNIHMSHKLGRLHRRQEQLKNSSQHSSILGTTVTDETAHKNHDRVDSGLSTNAVTKGKKNSTRYSSGAQPVGQDVVVFDESISVLSLRRSVINASTQDHVSSMTMATLNMLDNVSVSSSTVGTSRSVEEENRRAQLRQLRSDSQQQSFFDGLNDSNSDLPPSFPQRQETNPNVLTSSRGGEFSKQDSGSQRTMDTFAYEDDKNSSNNNSNNAQLSPGRKISRSLKPKLASVEDMINEDESEVTTSFSQRKPNADLTESDDDDEDGAIDGAGGRRVRAERTVQDSAAPSIPRRRSTVMSGSRRASLTKEEGDNFGASHMSSCTFDFGYSSDECSRDADNYATSDDDDYIRHASSGDEGGFATLGGMSFAELPPRRGVRKSRRSIDPQGNNAVVLPTQGFKADTRSTIDTLLEEDIPVKPHRRSTIKSVSSSATPTIATVSSGSNFLITSPLTTSSTGSSTDANMTTKAAAAAASAAPTKPHRRSTLSQLAKIKDTDRDNSEEDDEDEESDGENDNHRNSTTAFTTNGQFSAIGSSAAPKRPSRRSTLSQLAKIKDNENDFDDDDDDDDDSTGGNTNSTPSTYYGGRFVPTSPSKRFMQTELEKIQDDESDFEKKENETDDENDNDFN